MTDTFIRVLFVCDDKLLLTIDLTSFPAYRQGDALGIDRHDGTADFYEIKAIAHVVSVANDSQVMMTRVELTKRMTNWSERVSSQNNLE